MPGDRPRTLLAVLIERSDCTHEEVIRRFDQCARDNGTDATVSPRTLRRWLSGEVVTEPRPAQRRVARLMWGYPMSALLGPAEDVIGDGEDIASAAEPVGAGNPSSGWGVHRSAAHELEGQVAMATRRAADFTSYAEVDNIGPEAVAQVRDDIAQLATAYIRQPLISIMGDLVTQQEIVFRLLEGKQKPNLSRDLYALAALISGLIAKASQDSGRLHEAMTHARTLYVCADNADHAGLRAWGRGLQSLIAYWAGRPQEAVRFAQAGAEAARGVTGSVSVWLPALEARACAMMSADGDARRLLNVADHRREAFAPDDLDAVGGLLAFPVDHFEHGVPEYRSYSDEAGARAELALARVYSGHLEGAREALRPLLDLPPEQRIGGIVTSALRVHRALAAASTTSSTIAGSIREEIEAYVRVPAAALPA